MLLYSFNSISCPALLTVNVFEPCHLWCVVCAMCNPSGGGGCMSDSVTRQHVAQLFPK